MDFIERPQIIIEFNRNQRQVGIYIKREMCGSSRDQ